MHDEKTKSLVAKKTKRGEVHVDGKSKLVERWVKTLTHSNRDSCERKAIKNRLGKQSHKPLAGGALSAVRKGRGARLDTRGGGGVEAGGKLDYPGWFVTVIWGKLLP